jgi:hypothetical protein
VYKKKEYGLPTLVAELAGMINVVYVIFSAFFLILNRALFQQKALKELFLVRNPLFRPDETQK